MAASGSTEWGMTMAVLQHEEIKNAVNAAIAKEFEIDPARLVPTADLMKDLELDSLDSVDLIAALERTFKVKCPEKEARSLRSLQDIHAFVERLLTAGAPGAPAPAAPAPVPAESPAPVSTPAP
jgi:acyl carrier protein